MASQTRKEQKRRRSLGFEHRSQPLLPRRAYLRRIFLMATISGCVLIAWVLTGMIGYHLLANLTWVDSFLNTAMIVGGMGPVDILYGSAAKVFAGVYAILSGVLFLAIFGIMAAPIFHRFLHRFHLEISEDEESKSAKKEK
jgi:hypothetical protein